MRSEHKLRISKGNSKLGSIPSVSLPAIVTCPDGVPCAEEETCYVKAMYRYRKNILVSHQANLDLLNHSRESFFSQLADYLNRRNPEYFRIHVSGDFVDPDYYSRWYNTAANYPNIKFLAFTKAYDILEREHYTYTPKNLTLIASAWPGYTDPPKGYRVAWMQDGNEHRAPSGAIECPGLCESCGLCWALNDIGRDVVFRKH